MKIEGPRGVSAQNSTRRPNTTAAPGFAPAADEPQRAAPASSVSAVTSLDALLALQADEPGAQRRARQARRGRDALSALEKLEQGLLLGHAPAALRTELEALRGGAQRTGEPGLDEVLREIDTRVEVELAKLDRIVGRA